MMSEESRGIRGDALGKGRVEGGGGWHPCFQGTSFIPGNQ